MGLENGSCSTAYQTVIVSNQNAKLSQSNFLPNLLSGVIFGGERVESISGRAHTRFNGRVRAAHIEHIRNSLVRSSWRADIKFIGRDRYNRQLQISTITIQLRI
jgi:hypothetical protein